MVDEYLADLYPVMHCISRSDSSMVDEYPRAMKNLGSKLDVQIPLWSMNTFLQRLKSRKFLSSDSSMVDEYHSLFQVN